MKPANERTRLTGKDFICLSSIDWNFVWQGHQEIMATFAAQGNRVLFVENTGIRLPTRKDLPRVRQRIRNWRQGSKGLRREREGLFVYSPLILPFPYSRLARWLNRTLLLRPLHRWMRAEGFHHPVVWTFLPTPLALDLIRAANPQLTVYYCVDDLAASSRAARRIRKSESQLFRQADLVFVTSEKLRERAARVSDRVHLFPGGVSFETFEQARTGPVEAPEDLRRLPRPVVGYVGALHQWVDQELLAAVAGRLPAASFALVGPQQTDVSRLTRCSNVHLLGARPHADIPRYIKAFDVGTIPYRLSEYTASVYPTKLNEYLAMGIPVVATDLPEIRRFNAEHGEVVSVAADAEAFATAIREATETTSAVEVERRIEVARQNSWVVRIRRMSELIEKELAANQQALSIHVRHPTSRAGDDLVPESPNYDGRTVEGFGREWTYFDQARLDEREQRELFDSYFDVFPWEALPTGAVGFDMGCGTGRWAKIVAPRVGRLYCIDASIDAVKIARLNLVDVPNCEIMAASVDRLPLPDASMDFGYSLGVLHHVPDTLAGIRACVAKLKPDAPLLLCLYYAFDNRPCWFRWLWRMSDVARRLIWRLPFSVKRALTDTFALTIYWPVARVARVCEWLGFEVDVFPLSFYRRRSLYTMRTDALDRFGTRLERRFTAGEIRHMMEAAGLERIQFSDTPPYWCAVGRRKSL